MSAALQTEVLFLSFVTKVQNSFQCLEWMDVRTINWTDTASYLLKYKKTDRFSKLKLLENNQFWSFCAETLSRRKKRAMSLKEKSVWADTICKWRHSILNISRIGLGFMILRKDQQSKQRAAKLLQTNSNLNLLIFEKDFRGLFLMFSKISAMKIYAHNHLHIHSHM